MATLSQPVPQLVGRKERAIKGKVLTIMYLLLLMHYKFSQVGCI